MMTKKFKEQEVLHTYNGLMPTERAKQVYTGLEFDTSAIEAEWIIEQDSRIEAATRKYESDLRTTLSTWVDKLPSDLRKEFITSVRARWGEDFNYNDLHPIFAYERLNVAVSGLTHTGMDSQITNNYLPELDKLEYGLEDEEERLNVAYLETYQQEIRKKNIYDFEYKITYLSNFNTETYTPPPWKWDTSAVSYFTSTIPLHPCKDKSMIERDENWKSRYLPQIETLNRSHAPGRYFYYVGLSHGYSFLDTLRKHPHLVSNIKRYNKGRWTTVRVMP